MGSPEVVIKNLDRLFDDPTHSDIIVKCDGREWHLHKIILCSASKWFDKASKAAMKKTGHSIIKIKDINREVMESILRYLYTGEWKFWNMNLDGRRPLKIFVHSYIAANRFAIQQIEEEAVWEFRNWVRAGWDLSEAKARGLDEFTDAVELIYSSDADSTRGLRDCVISIVLENFWEIGNEEEFAAFRDVMDENQAMWEDLKAKLKERIQERKTLAVAYCSNGHRLYVQSSIIGEHFCIVCGEEAGSV